jgi:hypothetical protein
LPIDLNQCDKACFGCIKGYKKKHDLKAGDQFKITCTGIPKEYLANDLLISLPTEERNTALSVLDPVTWANINLDWHCIDPTAEIWQRKDPEEFAKWRERHPNMSLLGKSRYHRPYQADMLRCTASRKIFRIGRQAGKSETLCISILFNLFTKPGKSEDKGFKIILITPFQTQIDLIFTRLLELIRSNKDLQNSIKRTVKAPNYTLELHNGSIIRGFTAGTQSGGNANAVRGQTGDMLVFDEADLLSSGDMDSALAITTNSPNATVWMSSTPTGKREKFFQNCQSKLYKEFHYPSMVNPLWSEELEAHFKAEHTELGYKHEILAEFGEQEQGVFQDAYIQAAKASYKYGSHTYNPQWVYTIGVDWNDTKNGTTIVVTGFNPNVNHFYVVERTIVSKEGWTQLSACEKIAEYNRTWHPAAIYVDSGYGATQIEVLKKFSWDSLRNPQKGGKHPDSKIKDVLHEYNFSSKIQVHDLFTKQAIDKPAKPFLVENSVRRFETRTISFPATDNVLEKQLHNYIIDYTTQTGAPHYAQQDETIGDHTLDALMLSLVGFTLHKTPLGAPVYSNDIAFSGQFGEKILPDVGAGELIIESKKENMRDAHKPRTDRVEGISDQRTLLGGGTKLPANHTNSSNSVKLWRYDGFSHDGPKPEARTLQEAWGQAEKKQGFKPSRGGKPRRRNI